MTPILSSPFINRADVERRAEELLQRAARFLRNEGPAPTINEFEAFTTSPIDVVGSDLAQRLKDANYQIGQHAAPALSKIANDVLADGRLGGDPGPESDAAVMWDAMTGDAAMTPAPIDPVARDSEAAERPVDNHAEPSDWLLTM